MDNDELIARALARANMLLENPDVQGDYKKALIAACGITEVIIEEVGVEFEKLFSRLEAIRIPTESAKRPPGRPKSSDNPLPYRVKDTAFIAAIWAEGKGLNAREAAEQYLRIHLDADPPDDLVKNLQKRISDARRTMSL